MTQPLSFGRIDLSAGAGPESAGAVPRSGAPFRVLLLADWSGRGGTRPRQQLLERAPVAVDRDNFDDVLAASEVEVPVPLTNEGSARVPLRVGALDDFHPDQVIQRVQVFQALRTLRNRLTNPSTFAAAAEEMRGWAPASAAGVAPPQPAPRPAAVNPHDLLAQILGEEPPAPAPPADPARAVDWDSYLRQVIEPYLLPKVDYAQQAQLLALVEGVMSQHLRAILHAPEFQAAEAAWRGLFFLVRRLGTGSRLKLDLLDVSKDELAADLGSDDDLQSTQTCRVLLKRAEANGGPWGALVGLYTFDSSPRDVTLLGRMAKVASRAGAPFLAAASPRVVGCQSLAETPDPDDWPAAPTREEAEAWDALRGLPEAACLALALPRILLRVPYGKQTDPIEQFPFEEMPEGSPRAHCLWGNPAIACAYLLARPFAEGGGGQAGGASGDIDDLPFYVYREGGESEMMPCAEAWLDDRAAGALFRKGLVPVRSVRGRSAIRIEQCQSLAGPGKPLAGWWRG